MKQSNIAVVVIIIIIIISSISAFFMVDFSITRISAFEGRAVADRLAKEWNQEAILRAIDSGPGLETDGKAISWEYRYIITFANGTLEECRIKVKNDLSTEQRIIHLSYAGDYHPLVNFTLDSTNAMHIAIENQTINKFIDDYSYWNINMWLKMDNSTPTWTINLDASVMTNYYYADIDINAINGETISLDTTESGGTSHKEFTRSMSICVVGIIIIVVIIVVAITTVFIASITKQQPPPVQPPSQYPPNNQP